MRVEAGPLSATLDGLALRWVRWHEVEVLRGIAFVVRDAAWATCVPAVEIVARDLRDGEVSLHVRGVIDAPRLVCDVRLSLSLGRIVAHGTARAGQAFASNRTGFVLLYGERCAGAGVEVEHVDGTNERARFPDRISPHQPFMDVRALTHRPLPGLRVRVRTEGETFEMEDHRNWSDAGFKLYRRPLAEPRPFVIAAGSEVAQRVELTLGPAAVAAGRRPRIARGAPAAEVAALPEDAALLLAETRTGRDLAAFAALLSHRGRPGAVLLLAGPERHSAIEALAALPPLEAVLLADATAAEVRHLRATLPGVRIGAGSADHFVTLNRQPPAAGVDFVFWGVSATVHATDDASVLETLGTLADQARSARALAPGLPLWVGPIGIGPRWQADPRDASGIGAVFLAGHLEAWAEAGVETVILPADTPLPRPLRQ